MQKRSLPTRVVCAALLALNACQDVPTLTTPVAKGAAAARSTREDGLTTGQVPFLCVLGRRAPSTPSGWQTRTDTLFFPRGELDPGGRTVTYQFWQSDVDGKVLSAAQCNVPYRESALRRVDRYFNVQKGGGADQYSARQSLTTTQGCVTDGMCVLDPLVVVAPPQEPSDLPPCPGCEAPFPGTTRPGGGDGGGYGGGTGGSNDAYNEGPGAFLVCVGALSGVMVGTASLKVYMDAVYNAAGAVDSERRMLNVVLQNGGSNEMIQLYQARYDNAVSQYNGAVSALALATGGTTTLIIAAVVACSPSLLLPTP